MKQLLFLLLLIFVSSCEANFSTKKKEKAILEKMDTSTSFKNQKSDDKITIEETDKPSNEFETYYVTVADTSFSYDFLYRKMFLLSKRLNLSIDTLGRYYNSTKDLISLPENDADELYAGEYYPRRFPSKSLSLEYLNSYKNDTGNKTIALVTGIYETKKEGDSALTILLKMEPKSFKIKAKIFIGCLH
jgi:hypothetical protein